MDPALLPPLYVAHHETLGEPTEVFHNNIRERFNRGDEAVVGAMKRFAELAAGGREALLARDTERLARLIDTNFDTRRSIYRLPQWQIDMVETARRCGASAKFAGSGGAILGTYSGEAMFASRPGQPGCDRVSHDQTPGQLRGGSPASSPRQTSDRWFFDMHCARDRPALVCSRRSLPLPTLTQSSMPPSNGAEIVDTPAASTDPPAEP